MTVICTILVVAMHFQSRADIQGTIIAKNDLSYVVDFSKDAEKQGFDGDYSKRIVNRIDCVELK
jgi:hypothetical protein